MTDKPKIKREVGINAWNDKVRAIWINASHDAIADLEQFGEISHWVGKSGYTLFVDSRFDFDEVLEYVRNYG